MAEGVTSRRISVVEGVGRGVWVVDGVRKVEGGKDITVSKYSRHKKKVHISRPYNGTGNPVPFPFNFRAVAVLKPFPFCPTGSPSVLVNGPYVVIKHAQSLIAVISAGRLATVQ